jgi:hypothetical protein
LTANKRAGGGATIFLLSLERKGLAGSVELIECSRPPGDRRLFWPRQRGLCDQASLIELEQKLPAQVTCPGIGVQTDGR